MRDSLTAEELADLAHQPQEGHGPWSHTDMLIAAVIDLLKWQIFATYAAQGAKPDQPDPYPRPGVVGRRERRAISDQAAAHLWRLREEHARLHGYEIGKGA